MFFPKGGARKFFIQYLFFFLLVMAIPVVSHFVSNLQMEDVLRQNAGDQTLGSLKATAAAVDQVRMDVNNMVYSMENNSEIAQFLQLKPLELDKTIVSDVLNAQRQINTYKITNSYIAEIQLYAFQSGILVDTVTGALNPSVYYGSAFSLNNMSYHQWADSLLQQEHNSAYFPLDASFSKSEKSCLLYAQTLPTGVFSGNVMVYLDREKLLSSFQSIQYQEGGMVGALDGEGHLLFSENPGNLDLDSLQLAGLEKTEGSFTTEANGKTIFVFYRTSALGDWIYFAALPQQAVLGPSQGIQRFLLITLLISLLASGILALYFAGKTSRPLATVTGLLSRNNQLPSPKELPGRITRLLETNEALRETLSLRMAAQREALLYRLLCGAFHDEEAIKLEFSQAGLSLDAPYYCLVLAALPGIEGPNAAQEESFAYKQLVKEVLVQEFSGGIGVCDWSFHRCVVLLPGHDDPAQLRQELETQAQQVALQLSSAVEGGISFTACFAEGLFQIPVVFSRLQDYENFWEEEQEAVVWLPQDSGEVVQDFYYPLPLELRLIAAVQDGRSTMVERICQMVYQQNLRCLTMDQKGATLLLSAMYGTLLRLVNECRANKENLLARLHQIGTVTDDHFPVERFQATRDCFLAVTESYASLKTNAHASNLTAKFQAYVNKHFTDPQLSLTSVAEEFHITEPYLSRAFKQGTGENFSKYVERLRMEKARELISDGGKSLSEIALQVGYNSPQVFRRVYKKNFGVPPSSDN